jgi:type I restriction enzyme R subunit
MWLTGFDAPCLHTMYVDKPMRGHGLMQAIARVNRVYKDKPGGLIVDYLGLAGELRKALATYTASGGKGLTAHEQAEAVAVMLEKYETCCGLFHGLDWSPWTRGTPAQRLSLMAAAQDHILGLEDGRARLNKAVTELSQAFALAPTHEEATRIRDDVAFFQAVRNALNKTDTNTDSSRSPEEMDYAIRQLVSKAVTPDGVVDVFDMAGLEKAAGLSILSEEFLAQVRGLPHKNLALEILHKLLNDEIKSRARKQLVQARSFAELLDRSIQAYNNRTRSAAEIIEELIALARDIRAANNRGEDLGLTEEELAFYDALGTNDSAVAVLGDDTLKTIAHELVESIRRNASIDWTLRESIRAKMRVAVKRTLRRYGYPPDKQEQATQTVLQQAELLCADWAA